MVDTLKQPLELKRELLKPKRGDKFTTDFPYAGMHICDVEVGSKWIVVKPLYGKKKKIKYPIAKGRNILKNLYWLEAKCEAYTKYCVGETAYNSETQEWYYTVKPKYKKLPKRWREEYDYR